MTASALLPLSLPSDPFFVALDFMRSANGFTSTLDGEAAVAGGHPPEGIGDDPDLDTSISTRIRFRYSDSADVGVSSVFLISSLLFLSGLAFCFLPHTTQTPPNGK
jgi:hypothetical protein